MNMQFYAHSLPPGHGVAASSLDRIGWEPLAVHLRNVGHRAAGFAAEFDAAEWGRVAGLWHDLGKYRPEFQERLAGSAVHAPHAGYGAALAGCHRSGRGIPLAMAIAGHHTGLANARSRGCGPTPLLEVVKEYLTSVQRLLETVPEEMASVQIPPLPGWLDRRCSAVPKPAFNRHLAFFTRMLFSALVDADRLETAAFYAGAEGRAPDEQQLQYDSLETLRDRIDIYIDCLARRSTPNEAGASPINVIRASVLADCRTAAAESPGFFSLTVPTGGGKTLSAMSFALNHALCHGQRRVIVVIPFTSIIRQNAECYRRALGPGRGIADSRNVLEHHSGIDPQQRSEENPEAELRRQLAAENWDAPVIVTTSVQFFESLFSNRPARCRKLHRIANSVIVLDEVQTLPPHLLEPILESLRMLVEDYGCTVVLSTATPPALARRPSLPAGLTDVQSIVRSSEDLFASPAARRVRTEWRTDASVSYSELAEELSRHEQVLAIVHRRADARELCELLPEENRFHLSALMCPAHRIQRIEQITQLLKQGLPCRLIATQLIEAGVDLDFPVVYRALAGLDSLAQAAGRCDREGRRSVAAGEPAGRFVVFRAPTLPPAGSLRHAMETTDYLLKAAVAGEPELEGGLDPFNPRHGELYFQRFYKKQQLDKKDILNSLQELSLATAARDFQMIADGMRSFVVPWGAGPQRAEDFRRNPSRATARALQPFLVQVNPRYFTHLLEIGLIECLGDEGAFGLPTGMFREGGEWYSEEFGLAPVPDRAIDPEPLVC